VGAGLTVCCGLGFLWSERLAGLSYDLLFTVRPKVQPEEVVIIYMDEESHHWLKQPLLAPWDRSIHAQLLKRLLAWGAKAVAFDILFEDESTNNPAGDRALVEAARQAPGRVAVGAKFAPVVVGGEILDWKPTRPFEALEQVAVWGVTENSDDAKTIRQHFQPEALHSSEMRSLAWRVAELTRQQPLVNTSQERWMNFYGAPGLIPWQRYWLVHSNVVSPALFSNKVVFVGALIKTGFTGGTGSDDFRTPFTRWTGRKSPGVEINATSYLNLLRGDWLSRVRGWIEFLVVLFLGLVLGWGLTASRPLRAVAIGVVAGGAAFGVAGLTTWGWHTWFDWLVISGIQVPCAVTWALVYHTQRVLREKMRLEQGLFGGAATRRTSQRASRPAGISRGVAEPVPEHMAEGMRELHSPVRPPASSSGAAGPPTPTRVPIPDHTLLRQIGAGAYGEVWLAQNVMGRYRGVKIVYRDRFPEDRPYEREFEGIKLFEPISRSHAGLMQILHVGRNYEAGYYYYLLELADDMESGREFQPERYDPKTLAKAVARRHRLPVEECVAIGCGLTDALIFLHGQGLIHRDIKPSNIIFVGGQPKLADVGLVTEAGEERSFVGTMGYIPPEGPGTPMADLYSLGKVLYQAGTGMACRQFPELPTTFDRHTDAGFEGLNLIILKACEEDYRRRYMSAREMREDLERLATRLKKKRRWIRGRSAH